MKKENNKEIREVKLQTHLYEWSHEKIGEHKFCPIVKQSITNLITNKQESVCHLKLQK